MKNSVSDVSIQQNMKKKCILYDALTAISTTLLTMMKIL